MLFAQAHQVIHGQRKATAADLVRGALEVGEVVARHLLVRADEQVSELPPRGAGLRQKLGNRSLQYVFGEEKRRLERNARGPALRRLGKRELQVGAFVEEPFRV